MPQSIHIAHTEAERIEALQKLVPHRTQRQTKQLLASLESRYPLPADAIWVAKDGMRLRAAAMVVPMPGRTATVTVTPPDSDTDSSLIDDLLKAIVMATQVWDIDLIQALLDPDHATAIDAHIRAGFSTLAELITMSCVLRHQHCELLPPSISLHSITDDSLAPILESTYADTFDCPKLRGIRRTEDVIAGHRAGGAVHEDLWLMIAQEEQPIGCALVTVSGTCADLAYIGLIPEARNKKIGEIILKHIKTRAHAHGADRMRLAVDAKNGPALRLYQRCGLTPRIRHLAVICAVGVTQVGKQNASVST